MRAATPRASSAPAARSPPCASAGSRTGSCPSPRWTCGTAGQDADAAVLAWLRDLLVRLRDGVWREQLPQVPRLGRRLDPPDPDADLAEVMHADGVSSAYRVRSQFGRHYFEHLRAFMSENLRGDGFIPAQDALAAGPLRVAGLPGNGAAPRVSRHVFDERAWAVTAPVARSEPAFIASLLAEPTIAGIAGLPASTLLQALLRHALLREYAVAAARIAAADGAGELPSLLRDAELVDLVADAPQTVTWQRLLDRPAATGSGAATVRVLLERLTGFDRPEVAGLGATRRALAHLQTLDDDTLRLLTAGTLDAAGHRLDAWVTSFATRRLADLRAAAPAGLGVGGYGWVENLAAGPAAPAVADPPAGEEGPLVEAPGDTGFIHAPSATHAVTAALLRNAHLGPDGAPAEDAPFSITLSSWSSREAAALLDGIRQGQPLGALLGYRFERSLHEARLDRFVGTARDLAPLVAGRLVPRPASQESVAANDVVDGLALHRRWSDAPDDVTDRLRQAGAGDTEVATITACIEAVGESIDALADALTAETAYQAARGNLARTAGTLDAVARGAAPPPELEVTRSPRSGTALTHRLAVLLGAAGSPAPGWSAPGRPRAAAEPVLDGWAGRLLGDPRRIRCTARAVDEAGATVGSVAFALADLGLSALDAVHAAAAAPAGAQSRRPRAARAAPRRAGGGGRRRHARRRRLAVGPRSPGRPPARRAHARGSPDPGASGPRAARRSPRGGRRRLRPAARAARGRRRRRRARGARGRRRDGARRRPGRARRPARRGADADADALGVCPARPRRLRRPRGGAAAGRRGGGPPRAGRHGPRAGPGAARRGGAACAHLPAPPDARGLRERLAARMRAVFGPTFLPLVRFSCEPDRADELASALDASTDAQGGDPLAASTWLTRAQRVREPVNRFSAALATAEILDTGERLELAVAQLPYTPSARWVGLPLADGDRPPRGTVSVVVHRPVPVDVAGPLAALLVDEWVEVVPDPEETTAITFQLDPPSTAPPQSLLLAVPPIPGQPWTVGILQRVLAETFDLAKLRAVPGEALDVVGQYLPAVFLALNADEDAVSTDLGPLTRGEPT